MQASSHWLVNNDVMSGLRAVGLQSDAFGNGAQALISAMIFWRSQNVREATGRRRLYSVQDQVNEMRGLPHGREHANWNTGPYTHMSGHARTRGLERPQQHAVRGYAGSAPSRYRRRRAR